jgi:hypothetical protein
VSDQPVGGRFQRDRREAAAQVGFVHGDGAPPGGDGVAVQPGQGELVRGGEEDDRVGGAAPAVGQAGMRGGEVERGVGQLGGLVTGRQVDPGDEVEARRAALVVRHDVRVAAARKRRGAAARWR